VCPSPKSNHLSSPYTHGTSAPSMLLHTFTLCCQQSLRHSGSTLFGIVIMSSLIEIPPRIPSPTELCIVASSNSDVRHIGVFSMKLLTNTKTLRCTGLTPQINSTIGIQTLHISHCKSGAFLSSMAFGDLLQNCPRSEELHLENLEYPLLSHQVFDFTHQQLHIPSFMGIVLPWVMKAFTGGFPHLSRLVLTNIH